MFFVFISVYAVCVVIWPPLTNFAMCSRDFNSDCLSTTMAAVAIGHGSTLGRMKITECMFPQIAFSRGRSRYTYRWIQATAYELSTNDLIGVTQISHAFFYVKFPLDHDYVIGGKRQVRKFMPCVA